MIRRALRLQEHDPTAANKSWAALERDLTDLVPWVTLPDTAPVFEEYYDMRALWPPASLERLKAMKAASET